MKSGLVCQTVYGVHLPVASRNGVVLSVPNHSDFYLNETRKQVK